MPDSFVHQIGGSSHAARQHQGGGAILGIFGSRLPSLSLSLPIADRIRAALMRASGSRVPWQILGKDSDGRPCRGHRHLQILPFASRAATAPRRADRVVLWASGGLEPATLAVLDELASRGGRLQFRGSEPLRLEVLAVGTHSELCGGEAARLLGRARIWTSATSFVAPRFTKHRGGRELDTIREQLARLVAERCGCVPFELSASPVPIEQWSRFAQWRIKDRETVRRPASGWILRFEQPVHGPIAVGYGSHFGLGQFEIAERI